MCRSRSSAERAASSYLAGRVFDSSRDRQCFISVCSGELTGRGPATPAKRSVPFRGMRIVLSALRQLRVWHRWMCAGLPNRTGEIVPRGPLQDRGVSLPARISVLHTEEAGSAPARPATPCLLLLFLPLGRSVRRRILNPEQARFDSGRGCQSKPCRRRFRPAERQRRRGGRSGCLVGAFADLAQWESTALWPQHEAGSIPPVGTGA